MHFLKFFLEGLLFSPCKVFEILASKDSLCRVFSPRAEEGASLGLFSVEHCPAQEVRAPGEARGPGACVSAKGEAVGPRPQIPDPAGREGAPEASPPTSSCLPERGPPRRHPGLSVASPSLAVTALSGGFAGRVCIPAFPKHSLLRRRQTPGRAWTPSTLWTLSPSRKVIGP